MTARKAAARTAHKSDRPGATVAHIDTSRLDSDGLLVVVVDDVLTKNDRYKLVRIGARAGQAETVLAKKFKAVVLRAAQSAGFLMGARLLKTGLWRIDVLSVWPRQRHHKDGTKTAYGDSDAPVPMIKDALQKAGVIDDDMRIVQGSEMSCYLEGKRRTVAVLTRIDAATHAADVQALVRRVQDLPGLDLPRDKLSVTR